MNKMKNVNYEILKKIRKIEIKQKLKWLLNLQNKLEIENLI